MPDINPQTIPNQNLPPVAPEKPKMFQFTRTKLIIIGISVCAALVLVGILGFFIGKGTNNNPPSKEITATKNSSSANESQTKDGISVKLSSTKLDTAFENQKEEYRKYWNSTTSSARPSSQPEFMSQNKLLLTVAFTNTNDSKSAKITPGDLRLKDSDDKQYQPEFQTDLKGYTVSLNSGETTKIDVYFTLPSSQTQFKLIYQNVTIDVTSP
jgi:hypothetical protein